MKNDISENVILYDWLTVSSKDEDPCSWLPLLDMEDCAWEPMEHGRNGYRKGLYFGHISILYDGNPGMGSCLDMSGQGCRAFETYGSGDFDGLFRLFASNDRFHMTRLDVAFDDHSGILDIQQLFHDTDNQDGEQQFVSKFRKSKIEKEFNDGRSGITIYHGSKKSSVLFRIYDKAAERGLPPEQHWVRVEMQLRDDRALAFVCQPELIGERFRGVLVNYVRYVDDPGTDSNRWRWPMKQYWADLIDGVSRIRLYVKPGVEYNLHQLDHFVFDQASNAFAAAFEIYGVPFVVDKVKSRDISQNLKYKRLVDEYGKKGAEVCAAFRQGISVHRGLPGGEFQREAGEPGAGHGGATGADGPGLEPAAGSDR